MVLQQVRSWDVIDGRVLDTLRAVPREDFVPPRHRKLAFSDLRIPLGDGQVMMKPIEQGRALQALAVQPGEQVLEVGSGSGFLTACLARLGAEVTSLEILETLAAQARANLDALDISGVDLRHEDVLAAEFDAARFDAVIVTASVSAVPERLFDWLAPNGRLFIVRGTSPAMEAVLITRSESGHLHQESLFDTDLPRLIGAEDRPHFEF